MTSPLSFNMFIDPLLAPKLPSHATKINFSIFGSDEIGSVQPLIIIKKNKQVKN